MLVKMRRLSPCIRIPLILFLHETKKGKSKKELLHFTFLLKFVA